LSLHRSLHRNFCMDLAGYVYRPSIDPQLARWLRSKRMDATNKI
jgi:hypothetical protein